MKRIAPVFLLITAVALSAQTAPKASSTPKAGTTAKTAASRSTASSSAYKLPPGEKRIPGIPHTVFSLKYQDIKIGTGAEGESGKLWHVKYKGWRAADGLVFDNWEDHKRPVMGEDGKPVTGPDGKPKMGDPEPLVFPQGMGRLIVGFDSGVAGMKVGGKRRIFIPYQLAYGTRAIPDRPDHPGIPAKSDLIFDVELVEVTDMPAQPQRPMMPPNVHPQAPAPKEPAKPEAPATPPPAGSTGAPATQPAQPQSEKPVQPSQPSQPQQPEKPAQPTPPPSR